MRYIIIIISIALVFLSASPAITSPVANRSIQEDRSSLPINIKSNEMLVENKSKTVIFTGNVETNQGDITIFSDKLFVYYGGKKGDIERVTAVGNVRFKKDNLPGTGTISR